MLKYLGVKHKGVYNVLANVKTSKSVCVCVLFPKLKKGRHGRGRKREKKPKYGKMLIAESKNLEGEKK